MALPSFPVWKRLPTVTNALKLATTTSSNKLVQIPSVRKCRNQLRSEGTLLFDLSSSRKNYIASEPFIRSILPLVDPWLFKQIHAASAKLPRVAGAPTSALTYVKPMYIVSEDVTEKAEVRGPASVVLPTVHQTPDKRTASSGAATGKIKVSYYGNI